jgi:hypothetical protein
MRYNLDMPSTNIESPEYVAQRRNELQQQYFDYRTSRDTAATRVSALRAEIEKLTTDLRRSLTEAEDDHTSASFMCQEMWREYRVADRKLKELAASRGAGGSRGGPPATDDPYVVAERVRRGIVTEDAIPPEMREAVLNLLRTRTG